MRQHGDGGHDRAAAGGALESRSRLGRAANDGVMVAGPPDSSRYRRCIDCDGIVGSVRSRGVNEAWLPRAQCTGGRIDAEPCLIAEQLSTQAVWRGAY